MIIYIGLLILGLVFGGGLIYFILKPQLRQTAELDQSIIQANKQNEDYLNQLNNKIKSSETEINSLNYQIDGLKTNKQLILDNIDNLTKQNDKAAEIHYNEVMKAANTRLEQSLEEEGKKYEEAKEDYVNSYFLLLEETVHSFNDTINQKQSSLEEITEKLNDIHSKYEAALACWKTALIEKDEVKAHTINLSEEDLYEIKELRAIAKKLRNEEPLNKVIWKTYYERPTSDLIHRVFGDSKDVTGIYKITNLYDNRCYVGQAVSLQNRIKQHIKRGLGAESATKNKLYVAMKEIGVENFQFEKIEECPANKLNEREKYWINFFHGKDFGYNMTEGNST